MKELYQAIQIDPRHGNVITLLYETISERNFPAWARSFHNLNNECIASLPGYGVFMETPFTSSKFKASPSDAQKLLLMFSQKF